MKPKKRKIDNKRKAIRKGVKPSKELDSFINKVWDKSDTKKKYKSRFKRRNNGDNK